MEPLRHRLRGPWRLAIRQASMEPTLAEGDWLLVDPTTTRWPRRGSIVAFHEPDTGALAIKRVAARPGERVSFGGGYLELADDEAWLVADASADVAAVAGYGEPADSMRFGPVPVAMLVGRVWFRYAPLARIGHPGDPAGRVPIPLPPRPDGLPPR
ncbi:MAG: S26 family signal peptidase [Chloroflexota bacterium]